MSFNAEQSAFVDLRSRIAERSVRLVPVVGAGLSAEAGFPLWTELRKRLIEDTRRKLASMQGNPQEAETRLILSEQAQDPWSAFDILERLLGETTFVAQIRKYLTPRNNELRPDTYRLLWDLKPKAFLSLNLDGLAAQAYPPSSHARLVTFCGNQSKDFLYLLSDSTPFVCHAHGLVDNANSWVLTSRAKQDLMANEGYLQLFNTLLFGSTLLFVGINIADDAVSKHLRLARDRGTYQPHYWVTHISDPSTDRWAEEHGVQIIRYSSDGQDHGGLLQALQMLASEFQPVESVPDSPVLRTQGARVSKLPSPQELLKADDELIRLYLNEEASEILASESAEAYDKYLAFVKQYDRAIHAASYVSADSGEEVFGYKIEERTDRGGFAEVYKGTRDGKRFAIKKLHDSVLKNPLLLASFRRGVNSMRILKDRECEGVVQIVEATEMPPVVIMEWVDGQNLQQAITNELLDNWGDVLFVMARLAEILVRAHSLPERVLHRDLRPANIMIRFAGKSPKNITLLDFDLSWYLGAYDQTIVHEQGATGYLAPEQIHRDRRISTRSVAVDSFGLAMTFFYALGGQHPVAENHRHGSWKEQIRLACHEINEPTWKATRARVQRLIFAASGEEQSSRPDMNELLRELTGLLDAESTLTSSAPFIGLAAEEIALWSDSMHGYSWIEERNSAELTTLTNCELSVTGDVQHNRIRLSYRVPLAKAHNTKKLANAKVQLSEYMKNRGLNCKFHGENTYLKIEAYNSVSDPLDVSQCRVLAGILDKMAQQFIPQNF